MPRRALIHPSIRPLAISASGGTATRGGRLRATPRGWMDGCACHLGGMAYLMLDVLPVMDPTGNEEGGSAASAAGAAALLILAVGMAPDEPSPLLYPGIPRLTYADTMMHFCPTCANVLLVRTDRAPHEFFCQTCPYRHPLHTMASGQWPWR